MSILNKIFLLSEKIAASLLLDKRPKEIDKTGLFDNKDKDYIVNQLTEESKIKDRQQRLKSINNEEGWKHVEEQILWSKKTNNFWKYASVASVVLIIGLSLYLSNKKEDVKTPSLETTKILHGTDKAILTLENGGTVELGTDKTYNDNNVKSNGKELVYGLTDSTKNTKTISYNYLTVPRGGEFQLKLSDGTKIWLNADSKLKYPKQFIKGETREVILVYGEAYFDVSSSAENSGDGFKVITDLNEVTVLGTEFNIKAYIDEEIIYTTLVEGKVTVDGLKKDLTPNQQSLYNKKSKEITVADVDSALETSWRNGLFRFKGKSLKDIAVVLSRWYDIDFNFADKNIENIKFTGTLSRNQQLESILSNIKNTGFINEYKIDKGNITIR